MNATFQEVVLAAFALELPEGWTWAGFTNRPRFHEVQFLLDGPDRKTASFHVGITSPFWADVLAVYTQQAVWSDR